MYKQSVLPLIVDNYYNFTAVEKTIADYFISNSKKEDFSSKAMKERLFVSEASLSRFAKKCGFKGYREFIYRYEEGFTEKREQHSSEFKEVLDIYDQILKDTAHFVNEDQIKHFCQVLSEAKYVSVLGIGSSGLVAREMKFRFMRLGIIMEALDKSDDMKMQAVLQGKGALFIGISLSGKKEDVTFSLKKAHQNGATTILITANTEDEFPYCDEVCLHPLFDTIYPVITIGATNYSFIKYTFPLARVMATYNLFLVGGGNSHSLPAANFAAVALFNITQTSV